MTTNQPVAVILGADCLTGLQLARILWRKGIRVIGVADNPAACYCRTRATLRTVSRTEVESDPVGFVRGVADGERPALLPCSDEYVWWLNERRDTFAPHASFVIPEHDTLQLLADKSRFYRYALDHGMPLPDTRFASTMEEVRAHAGTMRFPLLVKPPRRAPAWMAASGGFKVLKIDTAEELLRVAPQLLGAVDEVILQVWIAGGDENMHSLFVCFDRDAGPLAAVVAHKLRQWPPDVGSGSLAVQADVPEVVELGCGILSTLGYMGPGSLQFKQDAISGQFFIIEMNTGRPALNFALCERSGVEMSETIYALAAGLPIPVQRSVTHPGAKWICWKTDLPSAYVHWKRGDLTCRAWLASIRGRKWMADLQWDDMLPSFCDMVRKGRSGVSRTARKSLRG